MQPPLAAPEWMGSSPAGTGGLAPTLLDPDPDPQQGAQQAVAAVRSAAAYLPCLPQLIELPIPGG